MKYFYDKIKRLLEEKVEARERKNKNRAIAFLLVNKYPQLKEINRETLITIVKDVNGLDRAWRKVLEDNESLRGSDYDKNDNKKILQQEVMLELGY